MGWETNVPTMLTFSKETYTSEYQVESEIEDLKKQIADLREDLVIYAMGNPKDFVENEDSTIMSVKELVKDTLELLEDDYYKLWKLECLLKNFKCRGGDFVENPDYEKNIKEWLDESYINGNIKYYNEHKEEESQ